MNQNDLLKYAIENGILDVSSIEREIAMKKRNDILLRHPYEVWKGKNGSWYTYLPDEEKGRILKKRKTKESIEKEIIDYYEALENEPILQKVFYGWIDEKLRFKEIEKGTYDRYERDYVRFFASNTIKNEKISKITQEDLEEFVKVTIADEHLSAKAYANLRTLINGTFKYAKKKKYISWSITNFFSDLDLSRRSFTKKVVEKEKQVFSENEVRIITDWLKNHKTVENLGVLLAFQTGIRVGELSGLKFSDVKGKTLHIQRMEIKYTDAKTGKFTHEIKNFPKTEAGERYIIITDNALDTIREIRNLNPHSEYMMQIGNRKIWTNTFNDRIYKACTSCGIQKKSMHKIRKTYGTTLIDANVDESLIMKQMGHADIETTRKYYYFCNKSLEQQEKQIDNAISI